MKIYTPQFVLWLSRREIKIQLFTSPRQDRISALLLLLMVHSGRIDVTTGASGVYLYRVVEICHMFIKMRWLFRQTNVVR